MTTSHQQRPLTLNTQPQKSDIDNLLIHLTVKERESSDKCHVLFNGLNYARFNSCKNQLDLTLHEIFNR